MAQARERETRRGKAGVTDFTRLVEARLSRRDFLATALTGTGACFLGGVLVPAADAYTEDPLDFTAVPAGTRDTITLPDGFNWHVVMRWGDPLWTDGPAFDERTRGTAASQELSAGDNNDGMWLFTIGNRSILAVNNEYVNRRIMFGEQGPHSLDDIRKGKAGHGVTLCEIRQTGDVWQIVKDSPYNRRITPDTPMQITGPARGHGMLRTSADPEGISALGTWSNCGSGHTPWGTYLSCEENFNGYFSSSDENLALSKFQERYGIRHQDRGDNWARSDERFDIARHPNEVNRVGYVVEIDPADPDSVPRKHTALGRLKHENAEVTLSADGRVVIYLGDDERGEFLYRFVSSEKFVAGGDNSSLLERGTLHAAGFNADGSGQWIELTPSATGMTEAEICILTRLAASAVGATTMDRPEWVAVNPRRPEAYCALTNNRFRGIRPNAGGDSMAVNGPNPRPENLYGQIVRWRPENGDHGSASFTWDLFVVAGNPLVHRDDHAGSGNIHPGNLFNSPDGIAFDTQGRLWILTDGDHSNEGAFQGMGNNQVLLADTLSGEIRRFLVGPRECEVTGMTWSADRRTMFIGIQHPGSGGNGHFPHGGKHVPRSCIIGVRRDDGGLIG